MVKQTPAQAEEELDRQYQLYKEQFDEWKANNANSIGTVAYNEYVLQFTNWEKDVERRRKNIRERAAREEQEELQKRLEEEEKARKTQAQKEAEDAELYLQSQQSYLAHHQAAIEAERAKAQMQTVHYHVATQNFGVIQADSVYGQTSVIAATVSNQQPAGGAIGQSGAPQLWGSNKITYDNKDPMFVRWGQRSAPPHISPILYPTKAKSPYWMVNETMQKRKKILAPQVARVNPPPMFTMPPINGAH